MNNILNKPKAEKNRMIAEHFFPRNGWSIDTSDSHYPKILYVRYKDSLHYKRVDYYKDIKALWPACVKYGIHPTYIQNLAKLNWQVNYFLPNGGATKSDFIDESKLLETMADALLLVLIAESERND